MIQHLVSRVLLRRFVNSHELISGLDLDSLKQRTDRVKLFGGIKDVHLNAPNNVENIWNNEVEKRLPYAFELLDKGTILSNPTAVITIKNCIALHYARGFAARKVVDEVFIPETTRGATKAVLERFTHEQVLYAYTGSTVSSDKDALSTVICADFAEKLRLERFMDNAYMDLYERGKVFLETKSLGILYSSNGEFLLGDVPVAAHDTRTSKLGILDDALYGKDDVIFMPLGPHHMAVVSSRPAYYNVDAERVRRFNVCQVRIACKEVYFRPGSGLGDLIVAAFGKNAK